MSGRIVIPGGSGFLGRAIASRLASRGFEPVVLSRSATPIPDAEVLQWDAETVGAWEGAVDGSVAVINLAGKSVNCRHTEENKAAILSSRVESTRVVGQAIAQAKHPPGVWLQASSLAYYGSPPERLCDEYAPPGNDFSADVCKQWERALYEADLPQTRRVAMRIGIVLGNEGGALPVLQALARRRLGGHAGSGDQYVSWIHLGDALSLVEAMLCAERLDGPINVTSPHPVTHRQFMAEVRRSVGRGWSPPIPAWAVRLGSLFMHTDPDLVLTGRRCVPKVALSLGYRFQFPELRGALEDLCSVSDEPQRSSAS